MEKLLYCDIATAFLLLVFAGLSQWISFQANRNSAACDRLDRKNDMLKIINAVRNDNQKQSEIRANELDIAKVCSRAERNEENSLILMIIKSVLAAAVALGIGLKSNA